MPTWPRSVEADVRIVNAHEGRVEAVPPRKRVALVGFAASSCYDAPWHDPAVELWGLNQAYQHFERRPDRWFEIHIAEARPDPSFPDYANELRALGCPIYMIDVDPTYSTSVRYPLERVRERVPFIYRNYFTSTAAYMAALALTEGFERIELYGIDCTTGTEYELQKPCLEAWLSLAMGRGIEVIIPETSSLFKTPFLYGYEAPRAYPRVLKASEKFLRDRVNAYKVHNNELLAQVHQAEGAIRELESLLGFAESRGRGARFPLLEDSDGE